MFIGNVSDDDIIESIYMAKYKNRDNMDFVGNDSENNEYFYLGNSVFLRRKDENDFNFSLMELPVSREKNGNVTRIDVLTEEGKVKFSAPLCSGYPVEVATAVWDGLEYGWSLACKVDGKISYNYSLEQILNKLSLSNFYGKNAFICSNSFRNIIENVLLLEKEKSVKSSKKLNKLK